MLENNKLEFDNDYFRQNKGATKGSIFAATYVNLTMEFFQVTCYDLCRNKFGEDLGYFILENWSRFLNDCET